MRLEAHRFNTTNGAHLAKNSGPLDFCSPPSDTPLTYSELDRGGVRSLTMTAAESTRRMK